MEDCVAQLREHEPGRILYEETSYWPTKQYHLDWGKLSDGILINLLKSVYIALEHDLKVLAAIGMRTVFDRASELVGVDPTKSFTKKLVQLYNEGHISATERERLEILTDAGSAAAHRGWEPNPQELQVLASIMEHFVRSFSLKEEAAKLKEGIPSRKISARRTIANSQPY